MRTVKGGGVYMRGPGMGWRVEGDVRGRRASQGGGSSTGSGRYGSGVVLETCENPRVSK